MQKENQSIFRLAVLVAALGYFVDIYDLLLFTIVRKPSLVDIGVTDAQMILASAKIIDRQMIGLLIGGVIWGIMGDRKGRLSVLFGSIMLYSVANFLTGYVQTVEQYAWARFAAGIGLAGNWEPASHWSVNCCQKTKEASEPPSWRESVSSAQSSPILCTRVQMDGRCPTVSSVSKESWKEDGACATRSVV